ncbi:type II secretion system F family protein [Aestuariivirga litoralis]|uniref:type II secretion system F family protein n=1 Tax=Aestuariivirga litoralis TaxID=2650924 RepID=UPI0018C7804F|nr:type II secretion system F family protein [Aestuariivirga litoralis]MBG1233959.1 type II secretion system F family protein [Aestuariivirga litoralis]
MFSDLISLVTQTEGLVILFASLAAFATAYTIVSPYLETDKLGARVKIVSSERDRLRAAQKATLELSTTRLREKKNVGIYAQLVAKLNLRKAFEAEGTMDMLKSAGLRRERHLTMFLALRAIVPIVGAIGVLVYTSSVTGSTMTLSMRLLCVMGAIIFGSYIPGIVVRNISSKRAKSIKKGWSDALDLMLICIESGMALEPAMQRVAKEIGTQSIPLAEEMQLTVAELAYLPDRRKALENLAKRTNLETVKSVVTALIQSERYGTPLGSALRVLAEENRKERMAEAERKAAALSPKLTVPMILFFLPVIFIVILGPSVIMVMAIKH